jgi:hypothetical protein
MGRRRGAIAVLALAAVAGSAASARADLVLPTSEQPGPNTRLAGKAVNDAVDAVSRRDGACELRADRPHATVTHDPPPPEMLAAFGVLRRPATPEDALDLGDLGFEGRVAVDYVRRARVLPDGTAIYVIPSLDSRLALRPVPADCFARQREALEHRLRGKPEPAQRLARRLLHQLQDSWRLAAKRAPQPGLFLQERGPNGSGAGGGGGDADTISKGGGIMTSGDGAQSRVTGLVPDGVATIDFTFARGHSVGPGSRRVYRRLYRHTAAVVNNVVTLKVPREPEDALYSRQVWRAADGSVIKTVAPLF